MKNYYIQAVFELVQSGADSQKILQGLKEAMQRKGHMRLYAPVLRGVLRILETASDSMQPIVIVAKESDVKKYIKDIKEVLEKLKSDTDFSTTIDETIIGGVIIKNNNTIVDRSYKTALINLYRSVTK